MLYRQSKATLAIVILLLLLTACYSGRRQQYLALLDQADSLNRAYAQMPPDSLLREATDFFDRHGSADERVRAHYLLGCAYRDLGQAPEALQAWHDALDRADTLTTDSAALQRIMAVYGQMSELFFQQNLPAEELDAEKKFEKYALAQKDTLNYIRGLELECRVYDLLGDTIKWTERLETAARLYREIGLDNYAVRTLSSIICVNVERGDLELAAQQMRLYENNSGLFDEDGNIQAGLEIYYYFKGSYYLQKGAADSAEYYMRKLLGYDDVNACRGLIKLYRKKQVIDSVAKYSMLFEAANDSVTNARRTGIIHQMSSLYKYHQFQVKADKAEKRERRTRLFAIAFVVIAFTVISGGFYIHRRFRAKKLSEINKLSLKYSRALSDYHRINEDLDLLRTNSHALLEKKKQETDVLKAKIREYQERWQTISQSDKEEALKNSDLVRQFHDKARGSRKTTLPTVDMWMSLSKQFAQNMPFIHAIMTNAVDKLSVLESRAYMLLELDFSNSEICILLDVSPQRLSNIKTRINQKLFNDNSASTLKSNVNNALRADL